MKTLQDDVNPCKGRTAVQSLHVVIVGAGIAGLTSGLALAQTGHSVTILESSQVAEVGAGIQLAPNATRILHRLGVLEEVMIETAVLSRVSIRRYDSDEELNSSPLMPGIGERYGAPMGVIHRGDLQRILLNAAVRTGCRILTSRTVLTVDSEFAPRVQVRVGEGEQKGSIIWLQGDVVIAADGIQSTLRQQMALASGFNSGAEPTGDAAYRLLIPRARIQSNAKLLAMLDQDVAMRYMGPGGHIMAYPVKRNTVYNMVLLHPAKPTIKRNGTVKSRDAKMNPAWTTKGSRAEMLQFYRNWSPNILAWLEHAGDGDDDSMLEWDLQTYPPLIEWVRGSVVLVGDACHPMLPYVAQGAAQAIEDSAVLAMAFTQTSDVRLALRVYEALRKTRGESIAASASATGRSLHLPDGPEQRKRDEAIRNVGKANSKNEDKSDKWRDSAWQDYMWGVDVMRETVEKWEELAMNFR